MYDDVEVFCLFMGYTRSGHSLVGTVLDAHPEAVVAHEGKIFAGDERKSLTGELRPFKRNKLFDYLVNRSARQAEQGHRGWRRDSSSTNLIPGASNGTYTKLRVIGTKRGQEPPMIWEKNPEIFDQLAQLTGAEIRLLHVYRNPWDNIASMGRFHGDRAIGKYFRRANIINRFQHESDVPMHHMALEDLVDDPEQEVRTMLEFYSLPVDDTFLAACRQRIDGKPSESRKEREWSEGAIEAVAKRMDRVPWLERYPKTPWE
ncbi:sulfotransferase [Capillimicrobium parvum]|uniref:Sulfotransferase n=1 Tax=Capillimicrobium parvum TaxID=2884022 RepID=A0A9E6Y3P0_9ACTN|nr:sulfotransferase [Capillimicrobium parvum]UGS38812.1 hypothetical protein DSM104329_05242 [Capillimicrobium parvum]